MRGLISIVVAIFVPELVYAEINPYKEVLHVRPWESEQNYVTVRPGAHMFYWLYYADGTRVRAESKPLIIWIQGVVFAASGVANFGEIGPLNMNMEPRNHTWVKGRNVLLLDDPVGTGFSYVDNDTLLARTDHEIATDLLKAIEVFFRTHKGFSKTPTYLFGQTYGGKICPILAYYLHTAIKENRLKMNLKGIGIGSGFVNPKESIWTYSEFLNTVGFVDQKTYLNTTSIVKKVGDSIDNPHTYETGLKWVSTVLIGNLSEELNMPVNPYNTDQANLFPALDLLQTKMNNYVKPTLSKIVDQNLEWNYLSDTVYQSLKKTFLLPSTYFLEKLLNTTKLKVAIYNGNLDGVTPIAGATNWAHKLQWHGSEEFKRATRHPIRGRNNGFYKKAKQLSFWWVFEAGHWVPEDNPVAMEQILEYVISDKL